MNERLSLQDLVDLLAQKQGMTKKDAEAFLREFIALISETIEQNDSVKIKDFGTFKLTKINARKSVDVNTGEAIEIAAHYKLSFTPDKSLREAVNRPFAHFESVILEEGVSFDNIESHTEEGISEDIEAEEVENVEVIEVESIAAADTVVDTVLSVADENISIEDKIAQILAPKNEENITGSKPEDSLVVESIEEVILEEPAAPLDIEAEDSIVRDELLPEIESTTSIPESSEPDLEHRDENVAGDSYYEYKEPLLKRIPQWVVPIVALFALLVIAGILFSSQIGAYFHDIKEDIVLSDQQQKALAGVREEMYIAKSDSSNQDSTVVVSPDSVSSTNVHVDEAKTAATKTKPTDYKYKTATIEPGMTLRMLGLEHYGNKSFWVYIYQENKSKIANPNNVPLGTVLSIAPKEKYGIDSKSPESVKKARQLEEKIFKEFE